MSDLALSRTGKQIYNMVIKQQGIDMKEEIIAVLRDIENQHGIKIVYACESGSRAWGFPSTDSDFDVRFIYIHPPEWYLSVETQPDFIELPIHGLLDINGWDMKKALLHIRKSNPVVDEWLNSPIVYRENEPAANEMRELACLCFNPVHAMHHYLHIAVKN